MKEYKVDGQPDLVRTSSNNAIVNKNKSEYEKYLRISASREMEKNRINDIETNLGSLKEEINDLKCLLRELISK
jgi:hypothetical protein